MSHETEPETSSEGDGKLAAPPMVTALVLAWCVSEPHRAGEVAIPPPGREVMWGRGGDEAGAPRLSFQRHRPGRVVPVGEVRAPQVSRDQLRVRALAGEWLEIRSVGRASVLLNGDPQSVFFAMPGDVIEVGRQVALLVVQRPAFLQGPAREEGFSFGAPDAGGVVGESPAIWELRRRVKLLGAHAGHVLVLGESGTGKELVARALHRCSPRGARPLVARNAATLPEGLAAAELFGNLKSYPNPGTPERPGLVGEADGTTLFLDEIGELPTPCRPSS
ncbi:MAG: sigma 54-interacting transcriptional regulator [Polyangiaceae bacterium]